MKFRRNYTLLLVSAILIMILCLSACDLFSKGAAAQGVKASDGDLSILPNVYVNDIPVGGLSKEDALAALNTELNKNVTPVSLTVKIDEDELVLQPKQMVALADAESAIAEACNAGRTGNDQVDYDAALAGEYRLEAETTVVVDYDDLKTQVDKAAVQLSSKGSESCYEFEEDTLVLTKGEAQREIDADGLYQAVSNAFTTGQTAQPLIWQAQSVQPQAPDLKAIWESFTTTPANAYYDAETNEIVEGSPMQSFDLDVAQAKYGKLKNGESCTVQIQKIEPEITAEKLKAMLYSDILGSCDSTLAGSTANRKSNLTLVCEAINGTILNPGEVFSYNGTVGERTAEKGYKEAGVYIGGQTKDQLGGGICQAASTIYLAALRANLEIVERWQHDFLVTYVPMGCDATVYWGVYDFKFQNDTDYPIRIDAWVADDYVHVQLWGTNATGQYAEMTYEVLSTTPYSCVTVEDDTLEAGYEEITTHPYTGYSVNTYRNVYDKDGNLLSSAFEARTNYKKRDQVTTIGTKGLNTEPPEEESPAPSETPQESAEPSPEVIIGEEEAEASPSPSPSQVPAETVDDGNRDANIY